MVTKTLESRGRLAQKASAVRGTCNLSFKEVFRRFMSGETTRKLARECGIKVGDVEQILRDRGRQELLRAFR